MSAAPRLAARGRLASGYYWFNFFSCGKNLFLYIFPGMYYFTILYILQSSMLLAARFDLPARSIL